MKIESTIALLATVMLAGCATAVPPARIETRFGDGSTPRLVLRDARASNKDRPAEVATRIGTGYRLDEDTFAQRPVEALAYVLQEELGADMAKLKGPLDVLALDTVTVSASPRTQRGGPPLMYGGNPAGGIAAYLAIGAIDSLVRQGSYQPRLHVKTVLAYDGRQVTCEGTSLLPDNAAAGASWREAMRETGRECRKRLLVSEEP
jgi:hypothetical protein